MHKLELDDDDVVIVFRSEEQDSAYSVHVMGPPIAKGQEFKCNQITAGAVSLFIQDEENMHHIMEQFSLAMKEEEALDK